MTDAEHRLQQLQQIPVLALRELVGEHLDNPGLGSVIRERFYSVLHRKPRNFHRALGRLTREQLTVLINASPEISDDEIIRQFEEHRYGISPSFYIYLFDPAQLGQLPLIGFHKGIENALEEFNTSHEKGLPSVRRVALNDIDQLPDQHEIIEATYRFQSRLDYIDENENSVSPFQTLYGFFWLNTTDGYVILQARHPEVLKAIKEAIESAAHVHLAALVITKRFKNSMAFLQKEQMRSVKLHDPIPNSQSFRWLTISDDQMYMKNYQRWEEIYPEVRSARYRTLVEDVKETMLTIRCDRGTLSLAGAIPASLFRRWCLNSLGEVIKLHNTFQADAKEFILTLNLARTGELAGFNNDQKKQIQELIIVLLNAKSGVGADLCPLSSSPLEIASILGSYVTVQVPFQCQEPGCDPDEELLYACEICGKHNFVLQHTNGGWELVCREHRTKRWERQLPLKFYCHNDHQLELSDEILSDIINVIPGPDLLNTIADTINCYIKGYTFQPSKETFLIRGRSLLYFPDRDKAWARILVIQNVGTVESGGKVTGIETTASQHA